MPVGTLAHDRSLKLFIVLRMLARQKVWVINDYRSVSNEDPDEYPVPPLKRVATIPGTDIAVSVGLLSGLFTKHPTILTVQGTGGFKVQDAVRLGGVIQVALGSQVYLPSRPQFLH